MNYCPVRRPRVRIFSRGEIIRIRSAVDELPPGAIQYRNDAGGARFLGAAPPANHPAHRYFINVYALDTADLGVPADATCSLLGFNLFGHTIASAQMIVMAGT